MYKHQMPYKAVKNQASGKAGTHILKRGLDQG